MKKVKAGIKTLYGEFNLGNKLQNYAVVYNLKNLGCEVTTFQYQTKAKSSLIKIKNQTKSLIKQVLSVLPFVSRWDTKHYINEKKRIEIFRAFSCKYLSISKPMNKFKIDQAYIDTFDYVFIGSDQVWNEEFLDRDDLKYFLGLYDKAKTIGLSGSFGISEVSDSYTEIYEKGFKKMDALSVREEAGAEIVQGLTGYRPVVLVDPVMSLSQDEWLEISEPPIWKLPEAYILCYFLGKKTNYIKNIEKIAQRNNLKIVDIMDRKSERFLTGPAEFIYLINNADFVCTDSFHGSAFSLIFNKPFQVFDREGKRNNMSSRLSTLLDIFDCRFASGKKIERSAFQWDSINQRIEKKKGEFFQFIKSSLMENTTNNTDL